MSQAFALFIFIFVLSLVSESGFAAKYDPDAPDYSGHRGSTIYVSKLGDDSDGRDWKTAYRTIQKALDSVPDDRGGHQIIIRPDTYMEANLSPSHRGAEGSYDLLIGDSDGRFGSGATGRVILDSGDPGKGFKSYDWWGPIRAYQKGWSKEHTEETFSAIGWDRWILRNLYVTGGDGGLFFDCANHVEPFTVVVEDCVSIGRAFGGGVASCLSRPDEPIAFRRCALWSLDWWGDAAGAYVRVENEAMPSRPDAIFEDCAMVGPQCALKGGNYGFHTYCRVLANRCRLVTLNFSQPAGTPTDGIVQSVERGKYFHVDFVDSTLMGYKVFGVKVQKETESEIGYTAKGAVNAYVQFQQSVPAGMHRLGRWPAEIFDAIAPPSPDSPSPLAIKKTADPLISRDMCEVSPFVWKGRLCLLECVRPATGGTKDDYYLVVRDAETGEEKARFGTGYSLACAFAAKGTLRVFASRYESERWNDITMLSSKDLKTWKESKIIEQEANEHLFNSSVCEGPDGYVMAYETDDPAYPAFTVKFAKSDDLKAWTKLPDAIFGKDRYTACPCIRYANGYYYLLYLEHRTPLWRFETYVARSKDLKTWELSRKNPVLSPKEIDDGINASDPDIVEFGGKTYLYYAVGDQLTWMNVKRREYPVKLSKFFKGWFDEEKTEP